MKDTLKIARRQDQQTVHKTKQHSSQLLFFGEFGDNEITIAARDATDFGKKNFDLSIHQLGDLKAKITKKKIADLLNKGELGPEEGRQLKAWLEHSQKIREIQHNENLSEQEKNEQISNEIKKDTDNLSMRTDAIRNFISLTYDHPEEDKMPKKFKAGIDKESFGTPKHIMDRIPYLPRLLGDSELKRFKDGSYKVLSSISAGSMGTIGLEYTVPYIDDKTPEEIHERYKQIMCEDALKAFLACWDYATHKGFFNFLANVTDIMGMSCDSERESYFSVKEKKHFWEMLRLLEATKLTITLPYKGKWITVNHQMLGITITGAAQKNQELEVGYLDRVHYRVLSPDAFQETAKWATELATKISKGTVKMAVEDICFALNLQIRAAQRKSYSGSQPTDEKHLAQLAGIEKTFKSNARVGRKRIEEKLDRSKEAGAIADWTVSEKKYTYKYNKGKKTK